MSCTAALTHSLNSKRPSMLVVSMKLSMFRTCPLPWVTLSLYLSSCRSSQHVNQQRLAGWSSCTSQQHIRQRA